MENLLEESRRKGCWLTPVLKEGHYLDVADSQGWAASPKPFKLTCFQTPALVKTPQMCRGRLQQANRQRLLPAFGLWSSMWRRWLWKFKTALKENKLINIYIKFLLNPAKNKKVLWAAGGLLSLVEIALLSLQNIRGQWLYIKLQSHFQIKQNL